MDYPRRKPNRLKFYDYSGNGAYFITICTRNRVPFLSHIDVGDGFPVPLLTEEGKISDRYVNLINERFPSVFVDNYVIMPNHIHLLLLIQNPDFNGSGTGDPSPTVSNAVAWYKYQVTKQINLQNNTEGQKIFQRSFHDHIIRNEIRYKRIYEYISNNPLKWKDDCFYCE